jgi:hypothetical protein
MEIIAAIQMWRPGVCSDYSFTSDPVLASQKPSLDGL